MKTTSNQMRPRARHCIPTFEDGQTLPQRGRTFEAMNGNNTPKIEQTNQGILINGYYLIEWERINSHGAIVEWIHHLSKKGWVTVRLISEIIDMAATRHGLKIYLNR